jgi:hypothetical protein
LYKPLRLLLLFDAATLFVLGAVFIFAPAQVLEVFKFPEVPIQVHYVVALWGCTLGTLAIGTVQAFMDPVRHVAWIQVAIARTGLEVLVGAMFLYKGIVNWNQSGFGIVLTGILCLAFVILYPRVKSVA